MVGNVGNETHETNETNETNESNAPEVMVIEAQSVSAKSIPFVVLTPKLFRD